MDSSSEMSDITPPMSPPRLAGVALHDRRCSPSCREELQTYGPYINDALVMLEAIVGAGWRVVYAPRGLGTGPAEPGFVEWSMKARD